jgi:mono/diheme cytochrome c family protein
MYRLLISVRMFPRPVVKRKDEPDHPAPAGCEPAFFGRTCQDNVGKILSWSPAQLAPHTPHNIRFGVMLVMVKRDRTASPRRCAAPAAFFLAGLAIAAAGGPQKAASQGREQRPPAFTEEQVQRGKSIYQKNCQDCHGSTLDNGEFGGAPLKGSYFRQHWGSGDVSALFGYVNTLMPPDRPGQLSPQTYADLTAFLLSNNGYAAGTEELTADQDAQRKMTMKK